MMYDHILGVDPGDTTGFAIWRYGSDNIRAWQVRSDLVTSTSVTADRGSRLLVVCEQFIIGKRTIRVKRSSAAMDVKAIIEDTCKQRDAHFELQTASNAKTFAPNTLLRTLGWYTPKMQHANDAARHVLLAVAVHMPREFERLIG